MGKDNKKKNNQSNKDTTSKRPASKSVADDSVMDVDKPLTPPGPVETTSAEIPSQPDTSSLEASQHAPANNNDKGKSPEITPAVSFPERAASPDASQAAVQSQPTLFYASAAPNDVDGFWNHFASNRDACDAVDRQLLLFSSYGSRATCSGSNDLKRIIVHFRKKEDLDNATASPMDSLFGLHFHAYDPQAIKADEHARTLVVTDIPLFLTDALLRGTFSRYGNITRCHTRLSKLYRTAYITFESTGALQNLDSTWGILCEGHCLRICPATFSPDQHAERRAYVALLAGLPRGTIAVDLTEIADEISVKSINHLPPSHPAKRHNRFARPDNNNDRQSRTNASRHRSKSRPNNRQQSRSRSQHQPWNRDNLNNNNNNQRRRIPDANELDHYADGMDVTYPAPPTVLTDWKSIGAALEKVVEELALLTTQFASMNSRITNLESVMAARTPIPVLLACSSSSSRPHDGVGILLRNPLHKHVQTIDPWNGRLLKLDLFFHQTKLSIISVYYPPSGSVHQSICNDLIAKLLSWLDYARANNYFVIILGDFNADIIAHSNYSPNHFKLLRLLSSQFFTDHQAHSSTNGPDPTFFYDNGSSRLDYIWSSPGFPAPGLFSQVITCPGLLDRPFTDHKVLTNCFDFQFLPGYLG
ncbi:hypothetical protein GLOIN_2v1762049 [Rhizophagus irregularis DAOM 181602=DAOM 197198]|nr:hypothetical protein GLOIN_2v1762049 [Rhizophagus irregularis DAOM 181602=DAOM 197198]